MKLVIIRLSNDDDYGVYACGNGAYRKDASVPAGLNTPLACRGTLAHCLAYRRGEEAAA